MEDCRPPSVFELIACDRLKSGLREALRYLLDNLRNVNSFRGLPIPPSDETIFLLDLLIEYNHLRAHNASYAENLYNLIRFIGDAKSNKPTDGNINSFKQILPSLLTLTLMPYIGRKVDRYFEELNYKDTRTADELLKIRVYRIFTKSYSFLNLICMVRFAAGKSKYHTLMDALMNVSLMSRTENLVDDSTATETQLSYRISKTLADVMGRGLTFGSYVIQFLDYWNTHTNSASLFSAALPIPDPPRMDTDALMPYTDDRSSNLCLICLHLRQNECVLSNTGYVFCYSCLQRYVTTKQRCPVTGNPTNVDNIVRLH